MVTSGPLRTDLAVRFNSGAGGCTGGRLGEREWSFLPPDGSKDAPQETGWE